MTNLLERLRELEAAATKGPWMLVDGDIWDGGDVNPDSPGVPLFREDRGNYRRWGRAVTRLELDDSAALIVAMRNALPELLDEVGAATAHADELEAVRDALIAEREQQAATISLLTAERERLREALEPFANVARQIRATGTDQRWLEKVLFYMGDDNDPSKWSLTGRAFDRALAALTKAG